MLHIRGEKNKRNLTTEIFITITYVRINRNYDIKYLEKFKLSSFITKRPCSVLTH